MLGLIGLDFDGTLLRSDRTVSERTNAALDLAADMGWVVVGATGRSLELAQPIADMVPSMSYLACANGSLVVDRRTGVVCLDSLVETPAIVAAASRVRATLPSVRLGFDLADGSLIWERGFERFMSLRKLDDPAEDGLAALLALAPRAVRKMIAVDSAIDPHDLVAVLVDALGVVADGLRVAHSGLPFVEIGAPGVSKASALAWLAQHLGIESRSCVVFGDEVNDHEMLTWAGTGVAMGNAGEVTKSIADHVTASNDLDGVAAFLESALFS
ncbi:MAG: Cof-type HAD-IIB family hydrolase [Acidimicrobiales bacterium]